MPRVSEFFGISIYIYYDDHPSPHFHAIYGDDEGLVRISDLSLMAGRLPPRALGLVIEWASARKAAIEQDWLLAQHHRPLIAIAPLE